MSFAKQASSAASPVFQNFENEIFQLKQSMSSEKETFAKLRLLESFKKKIENLRKRNSLQDDQDEIYMDLLMMSLDSLPRDSSFKKSQCSSYQTSIQAAFNPHAETEPIPAVQESLRILHLICS